MKLKKTALLCLAILMFGSATCEKEEGPDKPEPDPGRKDLPIVDGKVRFVIDDSGETPHSLLGVENPGTVAFVNGKEYLINENEDGSRTVDVDVSPAGTYSAAVISGASKNYYGSSPSIGVFLPYSQFYDGKDVWEAFPVYASYEKEDGNHLKLRDAFALLDLNLYGDRSVVSIKVENPEGASVAGVSNYLPSKKQLSVSRGLEFAVLNTTNHGRNVPLSFEGVHFRIALAPGNYGKGLDVTVCTADHRMMKFNIAAGILEANSILSVSKQFKADEDLLFYEGFDNLVWGGDYVGGASTLAFAPDDSKLDTEGRSGADGYEQALVETTYNNPGTGFFQSNNWSDVGGKTLSGSHRVSESYLKSRGFWDAELGFRSQEFQGYVGTGVSNEGRGMFEPAKLSWMEGISTVKVEFDLALKAGFNDDLLVQVINGGYVTEVSLDGKKLDLSKDKLYYWVTNSYVIIPQTLLTIAANDADAKKWHRISLLVEHATSSMVLCFSSNSVDSGNHGVFVDNIEVRKVSSLERGNLRILYWNIQNGMWADQGNDYKNFVAWVKKLDPDICVWCETVTNYTTNSSQASPTTGRYLPDGWGELASKYGHSHTGIGGWRDNFPQVVTSKYPISTILKITDTDVPGRPVSHGAGLQKVTTPGGDINIVTMHTWPQEYDYGVTGTTARQESIARSEGDLYREFEMEYVMKMTINNPDYTNVRDWLLMGDLNSPSRLDNGFYHYAENHPALRCQDVVLDKTDMIDIIGRKYPGDFMTSTYASMRIDYMYASEAMYNRVKNAMILIDNWNMPKISPYTSSFYTPSDHRPILVDFEF